MGTRHSSTSAPMKLFSILVIMIATSTVTASEEEMIVPEPTPNLGNTEILLQLKREIAELRSSHDRLRSSYDQLRSSHDQLRSSHDQHSKEVAKRFATEDELVASKALLKHLPTHLQPHQTTPKPYHEKPCHERKNLSGQYLVPVCEPPPPKEECYGRLCPGY